MPTNVKETLAAANAVVPKVSHEDARRMIGERNALVVDVRDTPEIEASGKVEGALHVPRGMLEFRADPETPYHDAAFVKDRPIILYCASGGRSALSGKVLKDLGYTDVHNLGAFKDWAENGGAIEEPIRTAARSGDSASGSTETEGSGFGGAFRGDKLNHRKKDSLVRSDIPGSGLSESNP